MQWQISVAGSSVDVELALHEAGDGFAEGGDAVVGVAAVFGLVDLLGHAAADELGGHGVVFADAEVEELALGMVGERLALGALDLLELVDRGAFAVVGAADAVGEERLEVGVAHRRRFYTAAAAPARLGRADAPLPYPPLAAGPKRKLPESRRRRHCKPKRGGGVRHAPIVRDDRTKRRGDELRRREMNRVQGAQGERLEHAGRIEQGVVQANDVDRSEHPPGPLDRGGSQRPDGA